jgi:hypothetical protein
MFGRKRKREEETPGLSVPYVSQPAVTMPVDVTPGTGTTLGAPSGATPGATPAATPQTPVAFTGMAAGQMPAQMAQMTQMTQMLNQMLGANGPIKDLIAEIKADPQAFRERMLAQAQAAGVSTFVMTPQGMTPIGGAGASGVAGGAGAAGGALGSGASGGAGAPTPQHVDVIDELTKAAALHDKGALTDAEFEALKKKLLGQ